MASRQRSSHQALTRGVIRFRCDFDRKDLENGGEPVNSFLTMR
jgi:hypothetical protein